MNPWGGGMFQHTSLGSEEAVGSLHWQPRSGIGWSTKVPPNPPICGIPTKAIVGHPPSMEGRPIRPPTPRSGSPVWFEPVGDRDQGVDGWQGRDQVADVGDAGVYMGNLVDWVSQLSGSGRGKDVIDRSLRGRGYDEEIIEVMRVACVSSLG
ncbi:hypothetical protein CRG98_023388 [Punica granatum]|uniref:Uncharacterized protein n=1 Tax=Punica granatum TaxID=22663 RepID=A0A2I0JJQ3_PUNGR|nr:hypothetical protein CRG98_023388 [Punica granatum]